jgi:hypothetical protein
MKFFFIIVAILTSYVNHAQIGIGTNTPNAILHLEPSNALSPKASDGFILPRISNFPTTNPSEKGIIVYFLGSSEKAQGYYYWDGIEWVLINSSSGKVSVPTGTSVSQSSTNNFICNAKNNAFFDIKFFINCYARTGTVSGRIVSGKIVIDKFYSFTSNNLIDDVSSSGQITNNNSTDVTVGNLTYGNIRLVYSDNKLYWVANYNACVSSIKLISADLFYLDYANSIWRSNGNTNIYYNLGRVGIGTNVPNAALDVVGDILFSGKLSNLSDKRMKKNIMPFTNGLKDVLKLEPVEYQYNNLYDKNINDNQTHIGLIAQDVEKIAPYLTSEIKKQTETGIMDLKAVKYNDIIMILINSIKELNQKIKSLEEKINK